MSREVVRVSEETLALLVSLAGARGIEVGEAADIAVKTGISRLNALSAYAGKREPKEKKPRAAKAPKEKKPKAEKPAKEKKPRKKKGSKRPLAKGRAPKAKRPAKPRKASRKPKVKAARKRTAKRSKK